MTRADFKAPARVRDSVLMKQLHLTPGVCPLCLIEPSGVDYVSLHHLLPRSQGGDDVRANLQFLCGSGTTGHHGKVESGDRHARALLGAHVVARRADFFAYLSGKLGSDDRAAFWVERRLYVPVIV